MIPISFDESNTALSKPDGMTDEQCSALSVCTGVYYASMGGEEEAPVAGAAFISCWRPNKEELEEINRTKKIWVMVLGQIHPPIIVSGANPFEDENFPFDPVEPKVI